MSKIHEYFDPKTKSLITIYPSKDKLLFTYRTWSELSSEEKLKVQKTLSNMPSVLSGNPERHEMPA